MSYTPGSIHQYIKTADKNGYSNWEIISQLIELGYEFPDAANTVANVLKLDSCEYQMMIDAYDNNA